MVLITFSFLIQDGMSDLPRDGNDSEGGGLSSSQTVLSTETSPSRRSSAASRSSYTTSQQEDSVVKILQKTVHSIKQNKSDSIFGHYIGVQLQRLPKTYTKELLKLDIQRLVMKARLVQLQRQLPQTTANQTITT